MAKRNKVPPQKRDLRAYRSLWRLVDGAVRDAFEHHPDYLAPGAHEKVVRNSITKRVVGTVLGFAGEARGRSEV